MKFSADFSEATSFEKIPTGVYQARLKKAEGKTSQAGNNYISWTLELVHHDFRGRLVWLNTVLSGKGSGILKMLVEAATGENVDNGDFDSDSLMGKVITIKLTEELDNRTGQARETPKVTVVGPASSGGTDSQDSEDIPF